MPTLTYKEAARRVLSDAGTPLHAHEICRRAIDAGLVMPSGKTPQATMEAALCVAARATNPLVVRTAPRTFALRDPSAPLPEPSPDDGDDRPSPGDRRIRIPHLPTHDETRAFLRAVTGLQAGQITGLRSTLGGLRGTPQSNVDWSNPDEWMPARLSGDDLATAQAIWKGSKGQVNPRHTTGVWLLSRNYDLLDEASDGTLSLSERGQAFLDEPAGEVVRDVDDAEGLLALLRIVGENGPASSSELQEPWAEHLHRNSRIKSDSATRSYLYQRLRNLLDRALVARSGQQYAITPAGMAWMGEAGPTDGPEPDPNAELITLVREKQDQVKEAIREILAGMDPYAFEHLVHDLLVEMGYVDVEVTSPSNDKGVDVVGKIELGITSVREVIQVKRHRRTIQRKDLDALRGCLHRFQAVRGTIITTSRFSSGTEKAAFEPGAAPITLIDGEKLVELLAKHEVGVKKRKVEVWELDESAFGGGDEG